MKKSILNLGKALDKAQQKQVIGGKKAKPADVCASSCDDELCWQSQYCI